MAFARGKLNAGTNHPAPTETISKPDWAPLVRSDDRAELPSEWPRRFKHWIRLHKPSAFPVAPWGQSSTVGSFEMVSTQRIAKVRFTCRASHPRSIRAAMRRAPSSSAGYGARLTSREWYASHGSHGGSRGSHGFCDRLYRGTSNRSKDTNLS